VAKYQAMTKYDQNCINMLDRYFNRDYWND